MPAATPHRIPVVAPRAGLRWQLIKRFLVVLAGVVVLGGWLLVRGYETVQGNARDSAADQTLEYVRRGYEQIAADWQRNGEEAKTQIDFMRIFADDRPDRWVRLRAYFAALEGRVRRFESGQVLRADGSSAFVFGRDSGVLSGAAAPMRPWYYSASQQMVFEPVSVPLWLGSEGLGRMVLLQAVDPAHLRLLAPPGALVYLVYQGRVVTGSEGSADIGRAIDAAYSGPVRLDGRLLEQRSFARFGSDPQAPRIVVHTAVKEPLSPVQVLALAVALPLLLSLLLWLVVGKWVQSVTGRVTRLSSATQAFAVAHAMTESVRQGLSGARGAPDEVTQVATASEQLMHNVVAHDEEHFAFVQTLDILEEAVVEVDHDGHLVRASPGWSKLASFKGGSEGNIFKCIHPDDVPALRGQLEHLFSGAKTNATGRLRLNRLDASGDTWVEYRFVPGVDGAQGITGVRGVLRDITQSYLLEKHISHMALHDALTGLPNRVLLEDRASTAIHMAERSGNKVAIGFIDLDHFKDINDHFGHSQGDRVLVSLAAALRQCLRAGDTLARWGGDEFVVLLSDVSDLQGARDVAAKLITACAAPIRIDDAEFNVTFSMGVAVYPDDAASTEALLSQADRAMFFAKDVGRNNVRFFADVLQKDENRHALYIQNRLATAIKAHQIEAWFQPVVRADNGAVVGCEALARWHDEEYGWVSPATFIPMAENLGLIGELGTQVWRASLQGLQRWRELGVDLQLAVNVSRRQLFTPSFTAEVLADIRRFEIPALSVELEVTESVAMDDAQHTARRLQELRDAGVGIAIDDFGTGYSSLSQLHTMPASKLKIDMSFVRRIHDPQGAQLVTAIVQMSHAFGLQTVAEGVEDARTADTLRRMGVGLLQGYHFGKPVSAPEFEGLYVRPGAVPRKVSTSGFDPLI
jgi:diguanylate cyclase (GGDEF)-like protein